MRASSLFTGALGVKAHDMAMSSVADNIANVSTVGFKGTRALFNTLISRQLTQCGRDVSDGTAGYVESNQVGLGVVCKAQNLMTAAALTQTELTTDLGIEGQGFFIVKAPTTYTSPFGTISSNDKGSRADSPNYYTRAGQFHIDRNGYVVNPQNYVLQGVLADATGKVVMGAVEDLRIPSDLLAGKATSMVELGVNLDAGDAKVHLASQAINPNDGTTYNYSTPATVYDSQGKVHNMLLFYQRVEPMAARSWKVGVYEKTASGYDVVNGGQFTLNFDDTGHLSLINNPTGDRMLANLGVGAGQLISSMMGEGLSYEGASGPQRYISPASLNFTNATAGGETVTVGAATYTLSAHSSAEEAAAELVQLINRDTTTAGCFAINNGAGKITLQPLTSGALNVQASSADIGVAAGASLSQVVDAVNKGQSSAGALVLNNLLAAGQVVSIGAQSYTIPGAASLADMAAQLAEAINSGSIYNATIQGEGLHISAKDPGASGNVAFSCSDLMGYVSLSAATLLGGLDNSANSKVQAQIDVNAATGEQKLALQRVDAGASATISGLSSTFTPSGGGSPLTFAQTSVAGDTLNITDGKIDLNFVFNSVAQPVNFNFTPGGGVGTTQQATTYSLNALAQNGYPEGEITDLEIDKDGNVIALYSNQQSKLVGTIALAHFKNPWDLDRYGDNLWLGTTAAGDAMIDFPNTYAHGMGSIQSGALEKSNVDMAQELVNMITYQRAYQFNTKSITTTDEMLKEAINMKR